MIKSLLDDEEDRNGEEEPRSGFLKRSFRKKEIVSIDLSSAPDEEQASPMESEEEIRRAIVLGPSSEEEETSSRDPWRMGVDDSDAIVTDPIEEHSRRASELERKLHEIEVELRKERASLRASRTARTAESLPPISEPVPGGNNPSPRVPVEVPIAAPGRTNSSTPTFGVQADAESSAETFRKSGMAWSAAIALFGSVVFMLVLGWFADLLFDSSPWGVVVGIVIGSIIGFVQFFRITSQILRPSKSDFERVSLRTEEINEGNEGTAD